jgi:hypothetical protein
VREHQILTFDLKSVVAEVRAPGVGAPQNILKPLWTSLLDGAEYRHRDYASSFPERRALSESFTCVACGKKHPRDNNVTAVAECRACRRLHCQGCLDENARCGTCALQKREPLASSLPPRALSRGLPRRRLPRKTAA